jgi:two-component system nitrogen regulation sensor histidine kinase NtrY
MNSSFRWIIKHRLFVFSGLMFLGSIFSFQISKENPIDFSELQRKVIQLEKDLKQTSKELLVQKPNFFRPSKSPFFVHIYYGDSLIYWNTNKIPVSKFATIQFPSEGINRLQNGWYYSFVQENKGEKVVVSCLLRNEFDYENAFLENRSNPILSQTSFTISLNQNEGFQIKNGKGNYLFSAISSPGKENENPWILVFGCISLVALLIGVLERVTHDKKLLIKVLLSIVLLRLVLFFIDYQHLFQNQSFVSAELFGFNSFFSTFLDFCLNILAGSAVLLLVAESVKTIRFRSYFLVILFFFGWFLLAEAMRMIVFYSTIPLNLLDFFDLKTFSFLALFIIGFAFYSLYRILELIQQDKEESFFYFLLISGTLFSCFLIYTEKFSVVASIFPILVFIFLSVYNKTNPPFLLKSFLLLILFSSLLVLDFNFHLLRKEQENRKLFASQIALEQDINLELAYANFKENLKNDQLIKSVVEQKAEGVSLLDFGDILEKKYFKGEWDIYDHNFNLCDTSGKSLFTGDQQFFQTCKSLIERNGEPSIVAPNLYFIQNSMAGYTYIIREEFEIGKRRVIFFVTLKSKRIPEEIGFPRLLISKNAGVLSSLEHYSIGKYTGKRLIRSFGPFHFPLLMNAFPKEKKKEQFINFNGYNHYILQKQKRSIVLSLRNYEFVDFVSAFAVSFCFFGLNLLFISLLSNRISIRHLNLSLSLKIQYAILLLVVFVLILFATGSGYYVQKQFRQSSDEVIEEKLASIEEELRGKISSFSSLHVENQGSLLESILVKLARVFETDLNIYDKNGYLVASSRSKVFNQGLLSEQINPEAFEKIKRDKKSFFTQNENIGNLNYISSYQPIYNGDETLLGYVNLQHFGQQQASDEQLKTFITAVTNVFIILLLLSIGIALFVSNWVTSPLKFLQKRVAGLEITSDVKIEYSGKDEIGTIVSAYNLKLDELKTAAKKLAKTERESAWREMAQQVAHEIKNPLTPMKLSIQQLLRVYDPTDEQATEKVKRVLNSIIEQIDGMTRIANEFSRFAKMPEPIKKNVDLISLIRNTVSFFEAEEKINFTIASIEKELIINIDKEQWVQVFNNLIQNAIHALEGRKNGQICISIRKENGSVLIEVKDNGCGISEEEQEKLFVPYFTTKSSGSGIGLSMVKQIVENHDGEISFVSELNQGTTFQIKL